MIAAAIEARFDPALLHATPEPYSPTKTITSRRFSVHDASS
jgi:hypothetical protein